MTRALVILLLLGSSAFAEPTRVVLVDGGRLHTDVVVWAAARAKLDAEKPKFAAVEAPDGSSHSDPLAGIDPTTRKLVESDPKFKKMLIDMQRSSATSTAWQAHEREVLDPIEADVQRALERYATAHGIAIVLDLEKLGDAVLVANAADITDAFVKDYNKAAAQKPASSGVNKPK